jgi:hypothetical protein
MLLGVWNFLLIKLYKSDLVNLGIGAFFRVFGDYIYRIWILDVINWEGLPSGS